MLGVWLRTLLRAPRATETHDRPPGEPEYWWDAKIRKERARRVERLRAPRA